MEWLGDTGCYGEGMVSLTASTAYHFISSCFAARLTTMRDSPAREEERQRGTHFKISFACGVCLYCSRM